MSNKIDFVCIGAQKAGTSTLYEFLKHHPEINLSPIKELNFFNKRASENKNISGHNFFGKLKHHPLFVLECFKSIIENFKNNNYKDIVFTIKYLIFPLNKRIYLSFINKNKMNGDLTPKYSLLNDDQILCMKKINPNMKIILLIRDPIKRMKSAFNYSVQRGLTEENKSSFIKFINKKDNHKRGDYPFFYENFSKYFENIFVYEDQEIYKNPTEFSNKICSFLDIDVNKFNINPKEFYKRKYNAGLNKTSYNYQTDLLKKHFSIEFENYRKHIIFGRYYSKWFEKYF